MKTSTCALVGLIFLLGLSMTSCGVGVEKQISFSEIPDPADYAITYGDLPSYFESDYWFKDREIDYYQEDETLQAKWYTVAFIYHCLAPECVPVSEGVIWNRVQLNQRIVTQDWFPKEPGFKTADDLPITWLPVSYDNAVGDITRVWLGAKEGHPEETYCSLMFSKDNALVYFVSLLFPVGECYDLLFDLAVKIEARLPDWER